MQAERTAPGAQESVHSTGTPIVDVPDIVALSSTCPRCLRKQRQSFTRASLRRLLRAGCPTEAYCVMCDRFWPLSAQERNELGRAAAIGKDVLRDDKW
jgi:hypothetical protein